MINMKIPCKALYWWLVGVKWFWFIITNYNWWTFLNACYRCNFENFWLFIGPAKTYWMNAPLERFVKSHECLFIQGHSGPGEVCSYWKHVLSRGQSSHLHLWHHTGGTFNFSCETVKLYYLVFKGFMFTHESWPHPEKDLWQSSPVEAKVWGEKRRLRNYFI